MRFENKLKKLGIRIYKHRKTKASYIKKSDLKTIITAAEEEGRKKELLARIAYHEDIGWKLEQDLKSEDPGFKMDLTSELKAKYNTADWMDAYDRARDYHDDAMRELAEEWDEMYPNDPLEEKLENTAYDGWKEHPLADEDKMLKWAHSPDVINLGGEPKKEYR